MRWNYFTVIVFIHMFTQIKQFIKQSRISYLLFWLSLQYQVKKSYVKDETSGQLGFYFLKTSVLYVECYLRQSFG